MSAGSFEPDVLALLEREREVTIETTGRDGRVQRTVIWVVVDDGEVFVRSWRGDRAKWYVAALERPTEVNLLADGRHLPVVAVPATDEQSVARCSAGLLRKYARSTSRYGMVREEILGTTLRLEPRANAAP
jgi:hypothetical protein